MNINLAENPSSPKLKQAGKVTVPENFEKANLPKTEYESTESEMKYDDRKKDRITWRQISVMVDYISMVLFTVVLVALAVVFLLVTSISA